MRLYRNESYSRLSILNSNTYGLARFQYIPQVTGGKATIVDMKSTGKADTPTRPYRFKVNAAGTVFATNTTISSISDLRFKENIKDIDYGLETILALKPRTFDWKNGQGKNIKNDRGFIAQEFEQIFPDLVDVWEDNAQIGEEPYKSIRQDLIPVLVKAIQELSAKNDALQSQINELKNK